MKLSQFVNEARNELFMGWTQLQYQSNTGTVCAIGALKRVAMRHLTQGGIQAFAPAQELLLEKAREMFPNESFYTIPTLNDRVGRTQQDMLDLFDKVTISLEETGS